MTAWMYVVIGAVLAMLILVLSKRLMGFTAQKPEDYEDGTPDFDIRKHLNGPIICEGVIYGPMGRVSSRFVADFDCAWEGDTGSMKERFTYDDGSTQNREWHLHIAEGGAIKATADDVVGEGSGRQTGPTVLLNYRIKLPADSGGHVLDTVDWMYLTPNGTIMNRSQFRKFGIKVAELVATMRPKGAA